MNFEHPSWLIAVPVALFLAVALFRASGKARSRLMRAFASDRLVAGLLASHSPRRRRFKQGLLLLALTLLVIACARPQWGFTWRETKAKGIDIMFVVDVSRSMLARDIKPDRLARAKLAILDFIDRLEGDRVGLVAFAGNAFLQCPLTLDYNAFRQSLEAIDTQVISLGGTDISRAINEAEAAFADDNNHKILVLITDGEDLEEEGIARARSAADNGVTIYTVGVGTPAGELIPVRDRYDRVGFLRDDNGELVRTSLDEDTLADIAEVTNGFYVPLGPTGYGLEQVYEAGLEAVPEQELSAQLQRTWLERFQWPLGFAIFLLAWEPLVGTRRKTSPRKLTLPRKATAAGAGPVALMLVLVATFLSPGMLRATVREGERLFRQGDYAAATEAFQAAVEADPLNAQANYNLGNALQALGQGKAAQAAYAQALVTTDFELQADAFYNLGSLRFAQGEAALGEVGLDEATTQSQQALQGSGMAMRQGEAVLREAESAPSDQQRVQQALQLAEQAKAASESAREIVAKTRRAAKPARESWRAARDDFQSSLDLNPAGEDAAYNANYIQQRLDALDQDLRKLERDERRHEQNVPALEALIEKLKELLEQQQNQQDNQQQNQDQQNQDQQDQDQQNQDQQQQDQNQQQDQSQQSQDSASQSESQQGEQDSSSAEQGQSGEQNEQEPADAEEESPAAESEDTPGAQDEAGAASESPSEPQSSEQNAGEEPADQQNAEGEPHEYTEEEIQQMIDALEAANQRSEEDAVAAEPAPGEESPEAAADQEAAGAITLSEEDAEQAAAEAARAVAIVGDEAEGETSEEVSEMGVMSREDARRLLESLLREEKKLPVSGYGRRKSRVDEEGKRKDW